jgi:hypothetical protein
MQIFFWDTTIYGVCFIYTAILSSSSPYIYAKIMASSSVGIAYVAIHLIHTFNMHLF